MKIKLDEGAFLPIRVHDNDAGADLFAREDFCILPGEQVTVDTGVHVELPWHTVGYVVGKSGLASRERIHVIMGTIDESYRGSIGVMMENRSQEIKRFSRGDKIAQLVVHHVEYEPFAVADHLSETDRGNGGFGSTGR